ncbi:MAG: hypothetical protein KBC12_00300 [Candidatus Pacebacteria bacterium]|nr:hypothetical protein [Candidatus Paceibacterota bacterium]MBP9851093.1 hypothetical protein [Candidatus Paceibacterota bacterium]
MLDEGLKNNPQNTERLNIKPFSTDFVKEQIEQLLGSVELIKNVRSVEVTINAHKQMRLDLAITAKGFDIGVTATLENDGNTLTVKEHKVTANFLARGFAEGAIKPHLDNVGKLLKDYIEKTENQKVLKIEIKNGQLEVTFEKTPIPTIEVVEEKEKNTLQEMSWPDVQEAIKDSLQGFNNGIVSKVGAKINFWGVEEIASPDRPVNFTEEVLCFVNNKPHANLEKVKEWALKLAQEFSDAEVLTAPKALEAEVQKDLQEQRTTETAQPKLEQRETIKIPKEKAYEYLLNHLKIEKKDVASFQIRREGSSLFIAAKMNDGTIKEMRAIHLFAVTYWAGDVFKVELDETNQNFLVELTKFGDKDKEETPPQPEPPEVKEEWYTKKLNDFLENTGEFSVKDLMILVSLKKPEADKIIAELLQKGRISRRAGGRYRVQEIIENSEDTTETELKVEEETPEPEAGIIGSGRGQMRSEEFEDFIANEQDEAHEENPAVETVVEKKKSLKEIELEKLIARKEEIAKEKERIAEVRAALLKKLEEIEMNKK